MKPKSTTEHLHSQFRGATRNKSKPFNGDDRLPQNARRAPGRMDRHSDRADVRTLDPLGYSSSQHGRKLELALQNGQRLDRPSRANGKEVEGDTSGGCAGVALGWPASALVICVRSTGFRVPGAGCVVVVKPLFCQCPPAHSTHVTIRLKPHNEMPETLTLHPLTSTHPSANAEIVARSRSRRMEPPGGEARISLSLSLARARSLSLSLSTTHDARGPRE